MNTISKIFSTILICIITISCSDDTDLHLITEKVIVLEESSSNPISEATVILRGLKSYNQILKEDIYKYYSETTNQFGEVYFEVEGTFTKITARKEEYEPRSIFDWNPDHSHTILLHKIE